MPRASTITQTDVDAICERLLGAGKTPTLRLIIAEHGSGSQSTVQPLLKDWHRRRQAATPAEPEHVLSPELLKALAKHFSRDVQVALAELKDQLETSEEACDDLTRENSALQALLRQRDAELVALSDQDAVLRGQTVQLENDLTRLRGDIEAEREARLASERRAAAALAQRDAVANQLGEQHKLQEELTALRVSAGATAARLEAALETAARQDAELASARQAEQAALQVAAELRGRLTAAER